MNVKQWIQENKKALPGESEAFYRLLHRRIVAYHHMVEAFCTHEWASTPQYQAKIERAEDRLIAMFAPHPDVFRAETNRDPRVPPLKVWFLDGRSNYYEQGCWAFHE